MLSDSRKDLATEMSAYKAYHQTRGNRFSHFLGIPLIVFSLFCALGWFSFAPSDVPISAATLFLLGTFFFYLRIHKKLALGFLLWSFPLYLLADEVATMAFPISLVITVTAFVMGWIFQLLGHAWEKNRPAFFTNFEHLWRGPLFITYEGMKFLGIKV